MTGFCPSLFFETDKRYKLLFFGPLSHGPHTGISLAPPARARTGGYLCGQGTQTFAIGLLGRK
jgi:hypothetical protein